MWMARSRRSEVSLLFSVVADYNGCTPKTGFNCYAIEIFAKELLISSPRYSHAINYYTAINVSDTPFILCLQSQKPLGLSVFRC